MASTKRPKPTAPARCAQCGGEKRRADDWTQAEQADPRCWVCRLASAPVPAQQNGAARATA